MSIAGDARFLTWNVYLEPFESAHRVRYILFFDIRNHKVLLVNSNNQQSSSYDFSCVSRCKISDKDPTLLTLYLMNTKQSYAVDFFFDSNYDRNCGNELLVSIINKTILKTATKYGVTADVFQIGCQLQEIINKKPKKVSEWKPRILSLIQNRILFFRDKGIDYHPLCMISLNERHFRCYKTLDYDHTIQIHLSNSYIYHLHLGDKTALKSLITKLKTALTIYNKRALIRFHPTKLPLNIVTKKIEGGISPTTECTEQNKDQSQEAVFKAHQYMQSDTDDAETESVHSEESIMVPKLAVVAPETTTTITHPFRFANMVNNSMRLQSIAQQDEDIPSIASARYSHCPQYSNQTECKLQQPISPISDALEPYKIVKNIAPKLLKQSSPISIIDQDGNEIMTMVRDESRVIPTQNTDHSVIRTISKIATSHSIDMSYKRGSICNTPIIESPKPVMEKRKRSSKSKSKTKKKKKKKFVAQPCIHLECLCERFVECMQCEHCGHDAEDHGDDYKSDKRRKKKHKYKHSTKRSRSHSKGKRKSKSRFEEKRKSAAVISPRKTRESLQEIRMKSREKRAASYAAKANKPLPKLPQKTMSKEEEDEDKEEEKREITERPMTMTMTMTMSRGLPKLTDLDGLEVARTLSLEQANRLSNSIKKLGIKRAESMLQIHRNELNPNANTLTLQKANTHNPMLKLMMSDQSDSECTEWRYGSRPQSAKIDVLQMSIPCKIRSKSAGNVSSPRYIYHDNDNSYDDAVDVDIEEETQDMAPLWDVPFDINNICTLIWGECQPKTMFPEYKYPSIPFYSDNLSQKHIYNISVAKEGAHCLGIGLNDWCFVWGKATNDNGVLGLGTNIGETTPFLLRSLRKERVTQTCCSALHSLCITESQVIYGWGSKRLTNLSQDTNIPRRLEFLCGKGLKYIRACNTHSLAYNTRSIHIYSWGMSGPWLGFDNDNCYPLHGARFGLIKFDRYIYSNKYKISSVDCSAQYTLILLNTGFVGCCGINEHGRMAIGKHVVASSKVLWSTSATLRNIVRISAGAFHSGYIDMNGKVYTCGVGIHYRLGHGNQDTVYKPQLIESLNRVKSREIECVDSTTYIITTDGHLVLFGTEPITNKTHKTAAVLTHLANKYRIYNVSASANFCVLSVTKTSNALKLPDIDNLNECMQREQRRASLPASQHHNYVPRISQFVKVKKAKQLNYGIDDAAPIAFSSNNHLNYQNPYGFNYKRNYNHWNRNYNQNNHSTHQYRSTSNRAHDRSPNDGGDDDYKYGKCNQAGCYCNKFVKSNSKWSKGKCHSCNHSPQHHKKVKQYPQYYYGQKKQKQKQKKKQKYSYK